MKSETYYNVKVLINFLCFIDFDYIIEFEFKIVDGIVITDMRTAAASAVATKVRRDIEYGYWTNVKPVVVDCIVLFCINCDLL